MTNWLGIFAGIAIVSRMIVSGTALAQALKVGSRPAGVTFTSIGTEVDNLDPEVVGEGHAVMRSLANEQMAIIVMTHGVGFARHVAERWLFADHGKVFEEGAAEAVLGNLRHPRMQGRVKRVLEHVRSHDRQSVQSGAPRGLQRLYLAAVVSWYRVRDAGLLWLRRCVGFRNVRLRARRCA
ncbi:hypothetical protein [Caballeronia sp. GAFFF1]|uniref:hypothetical protein n=1 Tax=Caballeronia sp. GAFFF1 TaxID=2921779 RepID=UPI002028CC11|nr:hypothetical protein [Caballeronia sp. GAFFF1]